MAESIDELYIKLGLSFQLRLTLLSVVG